MSVHPCGPYMQALSDIARALRQTPDGKPVAWNAQLLAGQVERELAHLRARVKELENAVDELEAWKEARP